jgi:hypothetical protein
MTILEKRFEQEMIDIYMIAKKECGYNASRFLQMLGAKGGLAAAKQLISNPAAPMDSLRSGSMDYWIYM